MYFTCIFAQTDELLYLFFYLLNMCNFAHEEWNGDRNILLFAALWRKRSSIFQKNAHVHNTKLVIKNKD